MVFFRVSPEGVDIVLDSLCGEDTNKGIGILKPLGKYILFGKTQLVMFYMLLLRDVLGYGSYETLHY